VEHGILVERDHGPLAEGAESFRTTRWTIVIRAAQSQAPWGPSALAELCRLYWYPLYTFARRRGRSPEDAQDLTQSFFLHIVEHWAFKGVDRLKGKFRSFLLASFQNHLSDAADHRLRKRYTALLREEVGRTVSDPAEIDEEIQALCEALIATEGRLGP
jgi:DNA-directed RNA polymerase specialized sigma24 family protein